MGDEFFARLCQPILTVPIDAMSTKTYQLNVHDLKVANATPNTQASDDAKQALLLRGQPKLHFFHFITKDYLP